MAKLTPKQENFCQKYIELGNASEAYRQSYDCQNMKDDSINRKAKELLDNGKITARLDELRNNHQNRHNATIDSIINELDEAREVAKESGNASAMINATVAKAKVLGLLDKKELAPKQEQKPIFIVNGVAPKIDKETEKEPNNASECT